MFNNFLLADNSGCYIIIIIIIIIELPLVNFFRPAFAGGILLDSGS